MKKLSYLAFLTVALASAHAFADVPGGGGFGGAGGAGGYGGYGGAVGGADASGGTTTTTTSGCAVTPGLSQSAPIVAGVALLGVAAVVRRRRRR